MGPPYRLFIHDEEDGWNIQGHYETIVGHQPKEEDYIEWPDKKVILFLVVSYNISTNINNLKSFISRLPMIPVTLYLYQALLAGLVLLQELHLFL